MNSEFKAQFEEAIDRAEDFLRVAVLEGAKDVFSFFAKDLAKGIQDIRT